MATKIRLKRMGKIRSPHYRIVVMDARQKRDGRAIEELGIYHPKNDPSVIKVNSERALYWLGVGAQPTEAVVALLKVTGDWQKFTGEKAPAEGVKPQAERPDKDAIFAAALAEDDAPKAEAISTKKKSAETEADDAAESPAEELAEAAEAADPEDNAEGEA